MIYDVDDDLWFMIYDVDEDLWFMIYDEEDDDDDEDDEEEKEEEEVTMTSCRTAVYQDLPACSEKGTMIAAIHHGQCTRSIPHETVLFFLLTACACHKVWLSLDLTRHGGA